MDNITNKLGQHILKKALQLQRLDQAVKSALPIDCREHIEIAGIRESQLIILTDSPVWQTRLRLYSQTMLEALHQQTGIKLTRVKLRLTPTTRIVPEKPPEQRILSNQSAKLIEQTANCVSDIKLQTALHRLSLKAKKSPD